MDERIKELVAMGASAAAMRRIGSRFKEMREHGFAPRMPCRDLTRIEWKNSMFEWHCIWVRLSMAT
jgi:hypothetical protein